MTIPYPPPTSAGTHLGGRYPQPAEDTIKIPRLDTIPFGITFAIRAATGVDMLSDDTGHRMAAAMWWYARVLPEYQGLTYEYVVDNWSLSHVKVVSPYDDADDVLEVAASLPVEPDPVIPEDGPQFPVVDP